MSAQKVIIIPFAQKENASTSVNITNQSESVQIYLKNCCVAATSAKYWNPDCDVLFVTNIEVPQPYTDILRQQQVEIVNQPFDAFCMPDEYAWSLAFYKLCALKRILEKRNYSYYCYLDSDVYVQGSFECIWRECMDYILLYDINHGLQVQDFRRFLEETQKFTKREKIITQYGGEFFAASKENAKCFVEDCEEVYKRMQQEKFVTTLGDEFIISLFADGQKTLIRNAGAYIYRFWTRAFFLVSTCYKFNAVIVLHVPSEKERGMINLYNKFISKGKIPRLKQVHKMLHLTKPTWKSRIAIFLRDCNMIH